MHVRVRVCASISHVSAHPAHTCRHDCTHPGTSLHTCTHMHSPASINACMCNHTARTCMHTLFRFSLSILALIDFTTGAASQCQFAAVSPSTPPARVTSPIHGSSSCQSSGSPAGLATSPTCRHESEHRRRRQDLGLVHPWLYPRCLNDGYNNNIARQQDRYGG